VQEAHGDRVDAGRGDRVGDLLRAALVERDQRVARRELALADLEGPAARDETSRVPCVTTSAERAPLRSMAMLIATVEPCTSVPIADAVSFAFARQSKTPTERSCGVVRAFAS
jgi:hypothetical protein